MRRLILSASILALAACDRGGGASAPPVIIPQINTAPIFTSAAAAQAPENMSGTIYTATADDADDDALSYSLAGSSDATLFDFNTADQTLSFKTPPNFEKPQDADADNIYSVTLQVTDGRASVSLDLAVTVTNVDQTVQVRRVVDNLRLPIYIDGLPDGTGRILVFEKRGRIRLVDPTARTTDAVDFMNLASDINFTGERGVLGIAFSPDFENDRTFYLNCNNLAGDTEIRRYKTMAGRLDIGDPATKEVLLTYSQSGDAHIGGWIGFDPSGLLFITAGDGTDLNTAQDDTLLLGKILRIDVNGDDYPDDETRNYAIPPGNMFSDPADGRPEIFSKGLRNPFRASFDPLTGDLLVVDVGANRREEINRLPIDDATRNFGWPLVEGTLPLRGTAQPDFTLPVSEYAHGDGPRQGASITGGYVYQGPVEALQNQYIFGDFVNNRFWAVPAAALVDGEVLSSDRYQILTEDFAPDISNFNLVSGFGTDVAGNLYIASYFGQEVFRLEAAE